jgi:hypothetical protein
MISATDRDGEYRAKSRAVISGPTPPGSPGVTAMTGRAALARGFPSEHRESLIERVLASGINFTGFPIIRGGKRFAQLFLRDIEQLDGEYAIRESNGYFVAGPEGRGGLDRMIIHQQGAVIAEMLHARTTLDEAKVFQREVDAHSPPRYWLRRST